MNKRKRHPTKKETLKKERKDNLIGFIVLFLVLTFIAIDGPFQAKAINEGNMLFMFMPLMLMVAIFAALIIWGMIKK